MKHFFYGEWSVQVTFKDSRFTQRFQILGSDNSDGIYPETLTPDDVLSVTGAEWAIEMEWFYENDRKWHPSDVKRIPTYTAEEGFIIQLGADDDTFNPNRDFDYTDLVLICKSLDPTINPPSDENPYDFTVPEHMLG